MELSTQKGTKMQEQYAVMSITWEIRTLCGQAHIIVATTDTLGLHKEPYAESVLIHYHTTIPHPSTDYFSPPAPTHPSS